MTITTRHKSVAVGTKLEYDGNGQIVSKTPIPRQQGTTVSMQNLFHTLPVRHKEFQRNLKKEFSKMVQVLNAYCIVNTGVRITCSNQTNKGSRSPVVSTNGNATVKDNIANIFGPKQLQSLLPFEQRSPTEDVCTDYGIKSDPDHSDLFSIEGFVSKCEHGQGRSSTDRQFLFINKRPCDASKIMKVINEVYHSYNRHQYPFAVLLIAMARESVDVNVTPDKRHVFMEGEKVLLATIKTSLVRMFEPTTSVLRVNMIPSHRVSHDASPSTDESSTFSRNSSLSSPEKLATSSQNGSQDGGGLSSLARLKRSFSSAFDRSDHSSISSPVASQPDKQRKMETFILTKSHSTPARFSPEKGAITRFFTASSCSPSVTNESHASSPLNKSASSEVVIIGDETDSATASTHDTMRLGSSSEERLKQDSDHPVSRTSLASTEDVVHIVDDSSQTASLKVVFHEVSSTSAEKSSSEMAVRKSTGEAERTLEDFRTNGVTSHSESDQLHTALSSTSSSFSNQRDGGFDEDRTDNGDGGKAIDNDDGSKSIDNDDGGKAITDLQPSCNDSERICSSAEREFRPSRGVEGEADCVQVVRGETFSGATNQDVDPSAPSVTVTQFVKEHCQDRPESLLPFSFHKLQQCLTSQEMKNKREHGEFSRSFRAKINPTDNKTAEEELQREISKDMFAKMDVLGQFNLGFIIAKNGEDLFIVDQHATDEKYNFEMLQRHTVLQSQQLIHPQCLELTASNEVILIDNLDIFRKNGFDFVIDETAPPTQRVKLKSTPVSKNWSFGKDDIEELVFMLTDSPGIMCRPSRVRMMFASRSCRKSIMIGTHLNTGEMKKLLCHMGEIEQPWNCPHGRPTMRHLINLNMLPK
ncbi:mismatch repair endonuclease PMS2-like isoform X1 [Littorina saxatilis]